jgi:hypothetical protein
MLLVLLLMHCIIVAIVGYIAGVVELVCHVVKMFLLIHCVVSVTTSSLCY